MEKAQPFQQMVLRKHRIMNMDPYLIPYTKPTQNGLKKKNHKTPHSKTPETDYRGKSHDIGLDSDFMDTTSTAQAMKAK